ncbi:hypothetical protein IO384_001666, partial [Campylobacter lari]|nr:hypothetical protein [Campylobacter lari]
MKNILFLGIVLSIVACINSLFYAEFISLGFFLVLFCLFIYGLFILKKEE